MKKTEQIDLNQHKKLMDEFSLVSKRKQRWRKVRRGLLIFLLLIAALHTSINIYASVLVNRELAAVRQKGEPLTLSEMAPDVLQAQNAAPLYRQAYQARNFKDKEENEIVRFAEPSAHFETRRPLILARNAQVFSMLRQAAARPACKFEGSWTQTIASDSLGFYSEMRTLARLMRAEAAQEARDGKNVEALRDVGVIYQMADHMKNEPTLIGFFVARAADGIASLALADVLEIRSLPAAQLQEFENNLPHTDWEASFRHTLTGERAFMLPAFEASRRYGMVAEPKPLSLLERGITWLPMPWMKLNELYYLRAWRKYLAELPPLQMPLLSPLSSNYLLREVPKYATIVPITFFVGGGNQRDTAEVARRQRQNAFAISAFRAVHGTYPRDLTQAATAWNAPLLPDPYNGKPFGYRSDGQTFTMYSVGPNRIDDNGRNGNRERGYRLKNPASQSADDLVWGTPEGARKK